MINLIQSQSLHDKIQTKTQWLKSLSVVFSTSSASSILNAASSTQNDPLRGKLVAPTTFLVASAYGISKNATKAIIDEADNTFDRIITPEPSVPSQSVFGEDAFMIANSYVTKSVAIADGVGGWSTYGVDPGKISRLLMKFAQDYVHNTAIDERDDQLTGKWPNYAFNTLLYAYNNVTDTNISKIRAGSTTVCIAYLTDNAVLHSANLGDSGFMVLRDGAIVYRSKEMQHRFNAPFQIGVCPKERAGTCIMDKPQDADLQKMQLRHGDMVVLGTDGLFDNLFDEQIVELIKEVGKKHNAESIDQERVRNFHIAKDLCLYARFITHLQHPQNVTPFGIAWQKQFNKPYPNGGKIDDISCVVCSVHHRSN